MKKLVLLLMLFSINSLGFSKPADNSIKQKTITVNGLAEMEITPDEIYVQIELREYDKKGSGKVDIDKIKNNFLAACKKLKIAETDLSVHSYQGWDGNYWLYKKNKKKNPDLNASITYWVKLANTNKMDELVKQLDDEATQNFFIAKTSHSKITEFKKQLKIAAVKSAKEKAIYLAEAIGEKAGEALVINEPTEGGYGPVFYANAMFKSADESATAPMQVDFKKLKLQFEVTVVFALK
jgi:uncharacterized protein YggE